MALPVLSVKMPADLQGVTNGNLSSTMLVPIHQRGLLHREAARGWTALVATSGEMGLPLTFTYGGCYRSYEEQLTLFLQRYTTDYISGTSRKTWNGKTWYLKPGQAMAAVPGTSNHGWGLAIDAAFDTDPRDGLGPDDAAYVAGHAKFEWWKTQVIALGFSFEVQSEPWHVRYVKGNSPTKALLEWEGKQTWFAPDRGLFGDYPERKKPNVRPGKVVDPDVVRYLQGVLLYRCGQLHVTVDGVLGPATIDGVKAVERFLGVKVDGVVGQPLWRRLDKIAA